MIQKKFTSVGHSVGDSLRNFQSIFRNYFDSLCHRVILEIVGREMLTNNNSLAVTSTECPSELLETIKFLYIYPAIAVSFYKLLDLQLY